jgi:hypothetical protein
MAPGIIYHLLKTACKLVPPLQRKAQKTYVCQLSKQVIRQDNSKTRSNRLVGFFAIDLYQSNEELIRFWDKVAWKIAEKIAKNVKINKP